MVSTLTRKLPKYPSPLANGDEWSLSFCELLIVLISIHAVASGIEACMASLEHTLRQKSVFHVIQCAQLTPQLSFWWDEGLDAGQGGKEGSEMCTILNSWTFVVYLTRVHDGELEPQSQALLLVYLQLSGWRLRNRVDHDQVFWYSNSTPSHLKRGRRIKWAANVRTWIRCGGQVTHRVEQSLVTEVDNPTCARKFDSADCLHPASTVRSAQFTGKGAFALGETTRPPCRRPRG